MKIIRFIKRLFFVLTLILFGGLGISYFTADNVNSQGLFLMSFIVFVGPAIIVLWIVIFLLEMIVKHYSKE